jgi:hypothetical protein
VRKMSKRDRRLLERLHGMLGSSNASEAESARQRLLELLAQYRKNWNDLTELLKGDADAGTWEPAWDCKNLKKIAHLTDRIGHIAG